MQSNRLKTLILGSFLFLICAGILLFGLLSHSVNFLQSAGISHEIVYLIETLPFIGLFLAFFRIILGINVPNMFVPIVIVLTSFILGYDTTLIILLCSLILTYLAKFLVGEFHLHFAVKSSLIINQVAIGLILILPLFRNTSIFSPESSYLIIIYGILVISTINEKFLSLKITPHNVINDLTSILKTILFSTFCLLLLGGKVGFSSYFIQWTWLKEIIIAYPDILLLALLLTLAIGRYTGLRVSEIIRFRKLIFKNN